MSQKEMKSENKIINPENKDRLFKFIFGNPENREWTLALYNAINHSNHSLASSIEYNTIEDFLYMSFKNDVSFIVEDTMNLYEHQSSLNPNMPMRFLVYAGMLYAKYIKGKREFHRFGKAIQIAPAPKCICFYNGAKDIEDKVIYKLSDAVGEGTDIEVTVTMYNINYGHNKELLSACKPLNEYSWFVNGVRNKINSGLLIEDAVEKTLDEMPADYVIRSFLIANKAEVTAMCLKDYNLEEQLREEKEDVYVSLVKDGDLPIEKAAKRLNMSIEDFKKIMDSQKSLV